MRHVGRFWSGTVGCVPGDLDRVSMYLVFVITLST